MPIHTQKVWYYLGGMTLFLFGVQVFTGILLLLYYRPSAAEAYESVQFIVTQVEFGWLIRNIHSWSANLLIAARVRALLQRVLPEVVPQAARADVGDRHPAAVPDARLRLQRLPAAVERAVVLRDEGRHRHRRRGADRRSRSLLRLLRGGDDVTGATLSRFYGLHVAVLPAITTALVAVHLLLVQRQGMSVPLSIERRLKPGEPLPQMPFFPNYILRDVLAWYVVLAVLAALAAFYPWELGKKADPFAVVPAGHPARVVLPGDVPHAEAAAEPHPGLRGRAARRRRRSASSALVLVLVPFLDRRASRGERSPLFTVLAALGLLYLVSFTIIGHYAK